MVRQHAESGQRLRTSRPEDVWRSPGVHSAATEYAATSSSPGRLAHGSGLRQTSLIGRWRESTSACSGGTGRTSCACPRRGCIRCYGLRTRRILAVMGVSRRGRRGATTYVGVADHHGRRCQQCGLWVRRLCLTVGRACRRRRPSVVVEEQRVDVVFDGVLVHAHLVV